MAYQPIEDYGIIGDLYTVALVGINGSIDFLCLPNFDSPSVFAALLDDEKGGRFRIAPVLEAAQHKQIYIPDSNILLTRFLSAEGVAEITDFMPVEAATVAHNVVRRVKTIRGEVKYRMLCAPRFDYGRASSVTEQHGDDVVFTSQGPDRTVLRLRSSAPVRIVDGDAVAEFVLCAAAEAWFVLEVEPASSADSPCSAPDYTARAFEETLGFWQRWIRRCNYTGRWREMVQRSALTLKLLTSQPHGSIVAAPTFGLPERIGGVRNWDYRYTWIRDASFTLYALMRIGFSDEAQAFMEWVEARCGELDPDGSLQVLYGIDGRHALDEQVLAHLEGYRRSAPVRVGNSAYRQLQLDICGELMDSVYLHNKYGQPINYDFWINLTRLLDWVCRNWQRPDEGIWEIRSGRHEFLYSRLMCWVALDRGVRLAIKRSFPAPLGEWVRVRDEIYREVFHSFWNPQKRTFVQHKGGATTDAAALMMPLVKFVGPTDPRWLQTLAAIERELVEDALVFRYRNEGEVRDGLDGEEGTFAVCSFWYVECLSRAGRLDEARFLFDKMLSHANHLGLYAEEHGARGEHLGNFPQAFTHLALISAAFNLNRMLEAR